MLSSSHCATHQIRLILVSAVVITSLFYPALAIYSSSQPQFLARISSRILESVAGEGLSSYHSYHDLHDPWSGYDTLHIREDSVARARCGTEGILRVERLLIHSALPEDTGALNNQILLSTLELEHQIGRTLLAADMGCLRRSDGLCFVLSPVAFWNYDEDMLLSDEDMLDTLQRTSNISIQGIPITPQMVLAGREVDDNSDLDFAMFLVLTHVFHETSCLGSDGHSAWVEAVRQAAGRTGDLVVMTKEPTLLALEVPILSEIRIPFLLRLQTVQGFQRHPFISPVYLHVAHVLRTSDLCVSNVPDDQQVALETWCSLHWCSRNFGQYHHKFERLRPRWFQDYHDPMVRPFLFVRLICGLT